MEVFYDPQALINTPRVGPVWTNNAGARPMMSKMTI